MADQPRQRVERVAGSRRARLTPAPGTDPSPDVAAKDAAAAAPVKDQGPNDARLRQDVPPHY
ncbi:hypothetical protein OED01_04460 [Microbacterium sp. M28]|uniref:hypothetical protein n=1 Tax=Microbacterium sp. M28 TaxID=2962064 RepID=UPI0021F480C7|nr:hypothetical protein [Microbacterium sp. M28]UYO97970.1 hypothetical protein OED01_04460 [Microbacterium sp. M28]